MTIIFNADDLQTRGLRDIRSEGREGRRYVATIGIDRYRSGAWRTLRNAVSDADGAARTLSSLGFERKISLLDETATQGAFSRLTDDLKTLSPLDSLVIFFAGHGYTEQREFPDGVSARLGYVVPADADGVQLSSFVPLDAWLQELARLPPRHILVILDCCGSGIALAPRYRLGGEGVMGIRKRGLDSTASMTPLRSLRSRRVITSALDEQAALDDGPIAGHSLFTGCLISALSGELFTQLGRSTAASSELFMHVRDQVWKRSRSQQTPDFGSLDLDERGELVLEQSPVPASNAARVPVAALAPGATSAVRRRLGLADFRTPMTRVPVLESRITAAGTDGPRRATSPAVATATTDHNCARRVAPSDPASARPDANTPVEAHQDEGPTSRPAVASDRVHRSKAVIDPSATRANRPGTPMRSIGASRRSAPQRQVLESAFASMLDRHDAERGRGRTIVSIISADALAAATSWAAWAAGRGKVTLVTSATSVDGAATELLAAMPWLRLLRAARARVATAAGVDLAALDIALREAAQDDCSAWMEDIAGDEIGARVAGWLLTWIVAPWGSFLDPATAPVQGPALLSAVCELAAPIAVLFHNTAADVAWCTRALDAAHSLADYMPRHAVAVTAPEDLLSRVLDDPGAGVTKLRRSVIPLARAPRIAEATGGQLAHLADAMLASDARTAGLFERGVRVPVHDRERPISVDLFARDALLAIEIDDWYRAGAPQRYDDDRRREAQLQRAGFYVLRFAADDIERRSDALLDEVALALDGRRASGSFPGEIR